MEHKGLNPHAMRVKQSNVNIVSKVRDILKWKKKCSTLAGKEHIVIPSTDDRVPEAAPYTAMWPTSHIPFS